MQEIQDVKKMVMPPLSAIEWFTIFVFVLVVLPVSINYFVGPKKHEVFTYTIVCNGKVVLKENATSGYKNSKSQQYTVGNTTYTPEAGSTCNLNSLSTGFYDNGEPIKPSGT